jgi:hypothetical protein
MDRSMRRMVEVIDRINGSSDWRIVIERVGSSGEIRGRFLPQQ